MNSTEQSMDQRSGAAWETFVRQTAQSLPYPPTPDVARKVAQRTMIQRTGIQHTVTGRNIRPVWVAGVLLAALVSMWIVPPVRAAILEFLQIGAVRIRLAEPTSMPVPPAPVPPTTVPAGTIVTATPTLQSTPVPALSPLSPLNLSGRTTLAEAAARAGFAIPLPAYPDDLGPPDEVFYQDLNGPAVILLWMQPDAPEQVAYSLHILSSDAFVMKSNPPVVATTTVNGRAAAWTNGPYVLSYGAGEEWQMQYLVSGRVLIWEVDGLTYRLESDLSLDEAIRMAESLVTVE